MLINPLGEPCFPHLVPSKATQCWQLILYLEIDQETWPQALEG